MAYLSETKAKLVDFSGGGVRFTGHSHRYDYELILVLDGTIGLQLDKKRHYHLSPGDFVLIDRGAFHWMWCEAPPGRYFNYLLQGDMPLLGELTRSGPFSLVPLSSHLRLLRETLDNQMRPYGTFCGEFYFPWVAGLLQRIGTHGLHQNPLASPVKGNFEQSLRRLLADSIEENPSERKTAEDLACLIGLERTYLARKIKSFTGKTLMEIYYEELFEQAAAFLEEGASVKEGAYRFGFANPYHFSRKFKEITGLAPSAWRQKKDPAGAEPFLKEKEND